MNIWLVNPYDNLPSEGNRAQRYWLMAEAFVRAGFRVVYWTSDFSHAHKRVREEVASSESIVASGIEVVQIPTLPYKKNICLARVKSHRKLAKDFEKAALALVNKTSVPPFLSVSPKASSPDLIVASTPPLGLCDAARRVARQFGALFVADVQDAWPETFERILPRFVCAAFGMVRTARRIYREADGVSAVAMRYIELAQRYGSDAPMHLAGHAIDMAASRKRGGTETRRNLVGADHRAARLVYVGNMSLSYDLETVIKAVSETPDVTLDIAGNGPDRERLEALVASSEYKVASGRIKFWGYLGEKELRELLRSCDVGLVPMFPASCVGVPGKMADYAAAGLRVIESLGGECGEIVQRYQAGCHYEAGSIASLKAAIREEVKVLGEGEQRKVDSDLDGFAKEFDAKVVMDDYVKWVGGLLECKNQWGTTRGPHATH